MQTKIMLTCVAIGFLASVLILGCAGSSAKTKSEKDAAREEVRAMSQKTLGELFQNEPAAKAAVAGAAGSAVFSDFGFKVMFMGAAKGKGVAVNNATRQETFMKMVELQPGLGLGGQKFRVVFIFENQDVFNSFVTSGWEFGADALAAAKDDKGAGAGGAGAVAFRNGVKMYQLSDTGAIVGVSITGAKYYKDKDLN